MNLKLILGCLVVVGLAVVSSCSDDPPPKAGISFEIAENSITESNGTVESFHPLLFTGATGVEIQIKVKSDKPLNDNAVIGFTVSGTATKNSSSNPIGDYEFISSAENITIEKGATEVFIKLKLFEDREFEIDDDDNLFETIVITLTSVISGPALIDEDNNIHTITVNEDDVVVILDWVALDSENEDRGDVDMDLLLQLDNQLVWGSASEGNDFEAMNIPAGFPPGTYGLSYTYYSGSSDDLEFYSLMFSTAGKLNGSSYVYPIDDPLIYEGHYTLVNINEWSQVSPPKAVQTMVKNGINYTNISQIVNPPDGGSRTKSPPAFTLTKRDVLQRFKTKGKIDLK